MTQTDTYDVAKLGSLTNQIMVGVKRFLQYGHRPSSTHWEGLRAIAENIEAQASGTAKPKFYLSSLPTGMGKTTVVAEGVKALISDPQYKRVGVVLFVNQLNQIPRLIEDIVVSKDQFAVRTGVDNDELNSRGRSDHAYAQVLFTTQQKLPHLLRYRKNFSEMPFFQYGGSARQVRIWDEAILPAEPLTFTAKQIEEVASRLTEIKQHRASALLRTWLEKLLPVAPSGCIVEIPTFILEMELGVLDKLKNESDLFRNMLWMAGQQVGVHQDDYSGPTTISYRETLPREFAPILVLDASGSLRLTYELWEKGRGDLVELFSPGKTYKNLTIHHWNQAAGKFAHQDEAKVDTLAEGISKAVAEIPADEQVLIIIRKQEDASHPNIEELIRGKVRDAGHSPDRLHFLTWGKHTATNEYADIKHVVVVGALQYSYAQNEAMARSAAGLAVEDAVSRREVEKVRRGEIAHHLFQAVGRGSVRKSVEGDCPPGCHLWIALSSYGKAPISPELLQATFPEARLENWVPVKPKLKKSEAAVVEAVQVCLGDEQEVAAGLADIGAQAECSWNTVLRRIEEQNVILRSFNVAVLKLRGQIGSRTRGCCLSRGSSYCQPLSSGLFGHFNSLIDL
jgi:hypothetical protein